MVCPLVTNRAADDTSVSIIIILFKNIQSVLSSVKFCRIKLDTIYVKIKTHSGFTDYIIKLLLFMIIISDIAKLTCSVLSGM